MPFSMSPEFLNRLHKLQNFGFDDTGLYDISAAPDMRGDWRGAARSGVGQSVEFNFIGLDKS